MMLRDVPRKVFLDDAAYSVAGEQAGEPEWTVRRVPAQLGEFQQERPVSLGRGIAGIIGSTRRSGLPAADGVADVTNGDISVPGRYGAGPAPTTIDLSDGNSTVHAAGGIGSGLTIGGGEGSPSIGGPTSSGGPTAIWADGDDDEGNPIRLILVMVGGRLKVVDPTTDGVIETFEFPEVDGGDSAFWAGGSWLALRGGIGDTVKHIHHISAGTSTILHDTDFTAKVLTAGPDALYRGFETAMNKALLKRIASADTEAIHSDVNWAPSTAEQMGDPGIGFNRLETLGERLVVGKDDGLYEFDRDFTPRVYMKWMRSFRWQHQANGILPLGQGGDVIVTFRRGLYLLPRNTSIGVEVLKENATDKRGRYTELAFDGNWIYSFLESPTTDDTHIVKMKRREAAGPGLYGHFPIQTLTDTEVLKAYIWPGGLIGGTLYGPRLYYGNGTDSLAYLRLGETQPDVEDANYRFTATAWSVQWPDDDFGSPATLKMPYRVDAEFENVTQTTGITWAVSDDGGTTFTNLDEDGSGAGHVAVTQDGFHQRFGRRDGLTSGRSLIWRLSGTGGGAQAQQRIVGEPVVWLLEQPETVWEASFIAAIGTLPENDAPHSEQLQTLLELMAQKPVKAGFEFGEDDVEESVAWVSRAEELSRSGNVILVRLTLRVLDFESVQ